MTGNDVNLPQLLTGRTARDPTPGEEREGERRERERRGRGRERISMNSNNNNYILFFFMRKLMLFLMEVFLRQPHRQISFHRIAVIEWSSCL